MFERGKRHLHVRCGRCDDTHELNVVTGNNLAPIGRDVWDIELFGDFSGSLAMSAGNHHYARAHAVAKPRYLRGAREASAYDSNADRFSVSQSDLFRGSNLNASYILLRQNTRPRLFHAIATPLGFRSALVSAKPMALKLRDD